MTVQGNSEPSRVCLGLFHLGQTTLPVREEGTNFLRKTENGGGGSVDLWSQKAQGITYPDGFQKSPVALAHISSFPSKVTRQETTSFASYQNGNLVFGL